MNARSNRHFLKAGLLGLLGAVTLMAGPAWAPPFVAPAPLPGDPEALVQFYRDYGGYNDPDRQRLFSVFRERQAEAVDGDDRPYKARLTKREARRVRESRLAVYRWWERTDRKRTIFASPDSHYYGLTWYPKTVEGGNGERVPAGDRMELRLTFEAPPFCATAPEPEERCEWDRPAAPKAVERLFRLMRALRARVIERHSEGCDR
jgi:hypothetical protein